MNPNFSGLFAHRHIGISQDELTTMLAEIGVGDLSELIQQTIPENIRLPKDMSLPDALTEQEYLRHIEGLADKNLLFKNFIGQGYYGTHTPSVLLRNIFQNPGWYTQYTPYQAEISQGRLEALLNFQTVVADLTSLPIANASLLDEGTAAAEAMAMFYAAGHKKKKGDAAFKFFVDQHVFKQTIEVVESRALPIGITIEVGDWKTFVPSEQYFGVLIQYPNAQGSVLDYTSLVTSCQEHHIYITVAADLLSLSLLTPPGEWGADCVVGSSQRFGVPMGYGGPHAAFFATKDQFKRQIPGRIIGVSVDKDGNQALRMALQTREQHIKREKATSNICTAQALLASMAGMYAVYHGAEGLKAIAHSINKLSIDLHSELTDLGFNLLQERFFDTLEVSMDAAQLARLRSVALKHEINFFYTHDSVRISIDQTHTSSNIDEIIKVFKTIMPDKKSTKLKSITWESTLDRKSPYLTHEVFHKYRTETEMMRYLKQLENKDLSLVHTMIPLGSCTMKLNAATELMPVSHPKFANMHPFVPENQALGYKQLCEDLAEYLSEVTGFKACSLQPNSGAQGELSGLMLIRAYHQDRNENHRNIVLIPSSAHGTNPASAVMAGMQVVVVECDIRGNIDMADLKVKAERYHETLAGLMVTYPSTHGVFEASISEVCQVIHDFGGLVYMDGANMNAQIGLTSPGKIGADVCHLNLHKTFAIPHGGGGPGMGPICVNEKLAPFLPGHIALDVGGAKAVKAVSSAPYGSASILLVSYGYILMLGSEGLTQCSEFAILNANYIKKRLEAEYKILYVGEKGRVAHELIIDLAPYKPLGIMAEDVAKRLIDYGFHPPTLSFPVPNTIMIEPTESENLEELDRFCTAMLSIKEEINAIAKGTYPIDNNPLVNAPHILRLVTGDEWVMPYTRTEAAFPVNTITASNKFWPSISRINNAYGDRNLICTCPSIENYREEVIEKS